MKKLLILCMSVFMAFGFVGVASASQYVFADGNGDGLADTSYDLAPGGTATFDIYVDNMSTSLANLAFNGLAHFGLNIYFNHDGVVENLSPPQVGAVSVALDSTNWKDPTAQINPFNPGGSTPKDRMAHFYLNGTAEVWNATDDPTVGITDNKILLGTIEIECLGFGTSILDLSMANVDNLWWAALDGPLPFLLNDDDFVYQDVTINQVPIPGALVLLGSGLLGLLGLRRRMKK